MRTIIAALILPLLLGSCQKEDNAGTETKKPLVTTVNYPLYFFADRLAGDFAEIHFDAPGDLDPAFWQPSPEAIARFQKSDLILLNGATYAKWLSKTSLPEDVLANTSADFKAQLIETEEEAAHAHGDGEVHNHAGIAFTTWLDFQQAIQHLQNVSQHLIALLPQHEDAIAKQTKELATELEQLHTELTRIASGIKQPLLASHPVYQYLARAYQLEIPSLVWEPEMTIGETELADLRQLKTRHPQANYFVWEGTPLPALTEILSKEGFSSIVVSPCSNRPENGDFLSVMKANLEALKTISQP